MQVSALIGVSSELNLLSQLDMLQDFTKGLWSVPGVFFPSRPSPSVSEPDSFRSNLADPAAAGASYTC